ncbi:MAG TPA: hypothetical protein VND22_01450 [Actinomycetota bacterium]|nr:hypothetical protein [Actinomycetota bacterium]
MKQLHIREPWADLAHRSDKIIIQDLVARLEILEARIRDLEARLVHEDQHAGAVSVPN